MLFGTYRYEKIIYVDGIDPKIVSTGSPEDKGKTYKREDVGVEKSRALPNVHDGDDPWEHPEIINWTREKLTAHHTIETFRSIFFDSKYFFFFQIYISWMRFKIFFNLLNVYT